MMCQAMCFAALVLSLSAVADADGVIVKDGDAIAFLGDSITAQGASKPTGYVNLVMKGLEIAGVKNAKMIPAGSGGYKSNNLLASVEESCLSKKPRFMTVSCGVNDVWHGLVDSKRGVSLADYQKNMSAIFDKAAAAGVEVIILTPTLILEEDERTAPNRNLQGYVNWLVEEAAKRKLRLANLNADMTRILVERRVNAAARGEVPSKRYFTYDGVHMVFPGNCMMAWGVLRAFGVREELKEKIKAAWEEMQRNSPPPKKNQPEKRN